MSPRAGDTSTDIFVERTLSRYRAKCTFGARSRGYVGFDTRAPVRLFGRRSSMANGYLFASGVLCLIASVWHGVGGEMSIMRRLETSAFPSTFYGDRDMNRRLVRGVCHCLIAQFHLVGITLLRVA